MEYGKNILQKYGWKEGKGLGKDENGISKAIKHGIKFDKSGIGYSEKVYKAENDQWWIRMFDQAAANVSANSEVSTKKSRTDKGSKFGKLLTDEELFEACGGRTAHKAARHGFKCSGKLKRVYQQEKLVESPSTSVNRTANEYVEIHGRKNPKLSKFENNIIENTVDKKDLSRGMKMKKSKKVRTIANE